MVFVVLTLFLAGLTYYHFSRNFVPGRLTPDGMDMVQAARNFGNTRSLETRIIRPLLLRYAPANPDGSLPDLAHAPLYPMTTGVLMKLARHTSMGMGDRVAVLFSLGFLLVSAGACYFLYRRLLGVSGAALSCVIYVFAANALTIALQPHPATLAATLFTLLLIALAALDVKSAEPGRRAKARWAIAAGALYGLLFLSAYSTLILLPALLLYLLVTTRRDYRIVALFTAAVLIVAFPLLARNWRVAGNPLFNTRLLELVMQTDSYPGFGLYRATGMPESIPQYLATGGVSEILRKAGGHLLGYYTQAPQMFGVLLLPLFLGAALTRFTDPRLNRLRALVYSALFCHVLGLSVFVPALEAAPLLLMYLPFAAALGTSFLLNIVRARNMPRFYARAVVLAWAAFACLPGIMQIFFFPRDKRPVFGVFYYLNTSSPEASRVRRGEALLMSEVPWEMVFRTDLPTVWLPNTAAEFLATEQDMGKPIGGIVFTPALEKEYGADASAASWWLTYRRITSLLAVTTSLDAPTRTDLLRKVSLFYPRDIVEAMTRFRPAPFPEQKGTQYTLMFWDPRLRAAPQATAAAAAEASAQ